DVGEASARLLHARARCADRGSPFTARTMTRHRRMCAGDAPGSRRTLVRAARSRFSARHQATEAALILATPTADRHTSIAMVPNQDRNTGLLFSIAGLLVCVFIADYYTRLGLAEWIFYILPVGICIFAPRPFLP